MYTRLNDAGTAFEPERNVIRLSTASTGWTVAADEQGRVYVIWHAGEGRGEAAACGWRCRRTTARPSLPKWPSTRRRKRACGCCGIRAAAGGGQVHVLYRSAENGMNRDMQLLSTDGGRTFITTLLSRWAVAQCPMSSASLTRTKDGFLAAWETQGQISYATIDGRGKLSKPVQVAGAAENRKHPVTAVNAHGETLLVWTEGTGWNRGGKLAWQVIDHKGKAGPIRTERNGIDVELRRSDREPRRLVLDPALRLCPGRRVSDGESAHPSLTRRAKTVSGFHPNWRAHLPHVSTRLDRFWGQA